MNIVNSEAVGIGNKFENDHNLIGNYSEKKSATTKRHTYKLIKPNKFSIWNTSRAPRSNSRFGLAMYIWEKKIYQLCDRCVVPFQIVCVLFENLKKREINQSILPPLFMQQLVNISEWVLIEQSGKRKEVKTVHFYAWLSECVRLDHAIEKKTRTKQDKQAEQRSLLTIFISTTRKHSSRFSLCIQI